MREIHCSSYQGWAVLLKYKRYFTNIDIFYLYLIYIITDSDMHVPGKLYSCICIQVLQSRKKITQQKKPLFEFTTEIAFLLSYYVE